MSKEFSPTRDVLQTFAHYTGNMVTGASVL